MDDKTIEQEARRLYDEYPTSKPTWDQLGEVTKSVWIDYVILGTRLQFSEERSEVSRSYMHPALCDDLF